MRHTRYFNWLWLAFIASALGACQAIAPTAPEHPRWAAYYDTKAEPIEYAPYHVIVMDSEYTPDLSAISRHTRLLGYVSMGEALEHQLSEEETASLVVETNDEWNSLVIDIRKPEWQQRLSEQTVPAALAKGFDGIMLDTVDQAIHLVTQDQQTYAGMHDAAVSIIRTIRANNPRALIMLNRGFAIHDRVASDIDFVLAESILSNYDLEEKKATYFPDDVYAHYVEKLTRLKAAHPHIKIVTLDYWDMNDSKGVQNIYRIQRGHGFIPYVSTPDLRQLYREPTASDEESQHDATYQTGSF